MKLVIIKSCEFMTDATGTHVKVWETSKNIDNLSGMKELLREQSDMVYCPKGMTSRPKKTPDGLEDHR